MRQNSMLQFNLFKVVWPCFGETPFLTDKLMFFTNFFHFKNHSRKVAWCNKYHREDLYILGR